MEPSARGRSRRGSTATAAIEDSGGRRGTRSGAAVLRFLPPRCSSLSRIRARDDGPSATSSSPAFPSPAPTTATRPRASSVLSRTTDSRNTKITEKVYVTTCETANSLSNLQRLLTKNLGADASGIKTRKNTAKKWLTSGARRPNNPCSDIESSVVMACRIPGMCPLYKPLHYVQFASIAYKQRIFHEMLKMSRPPFPHALQIVNRSGHCDVPHLLFGRKREPRRSSDNGVAISNSIVIVLMIDMPDKHEMVRIVWCSDVM